MGMDHLEDLEDGTVANAGPLTQCLTEIARTMGGHIESTVRSLYETTEEKVFAEALSHPRSHGE